MFRSTLEGKLLNVNKKSNAGVKPYDVVFDVQNNDFAALLWLRRQTNQKNEF